jgi:hypothetical protein
MGLNKLSLQTCGQFPRCSCDARVECPITKSSIAQVNYLGLNKERRNPAIRDLHGVR